MDEINPETAEKTADAARTRRLLEVQLQDRQTVLIDRLIGDYRSNKLVHDKMVGAIAEIAGMKEQIDKLTRTIRGA